MLGQRRRHWPNTVLMSYGCGVLYTLPRLDGIDSYHGYGDVL